MLHVVGYTGVCARSCFPRHHWKPVDTAFPFLAFSVSAGRRRQIQYRFIYSVFGLQVDKWHLIAIATTFLFNQRNCRPFGTTSNNPQLRRASLLTTIDFISRLTPDGCLATSFGHQHVEMSTEIYVSKREVGCVGLQQARQGTWQYPERPLLAAGYLISRSCEEQLLRSRKDRPRLHPPSIKSSVG